MVKLSQRTEQIKLRDSPDAGELFAERMAGFLFKDGNFSIALAVTRADPSKDPSPQSQVVVSRLVMPAAGVMEMVRIFSEVLKQLEDQGVIPKQVSTTRTLQ